MSTVQWSSGHYTVQSLALKDTTLSTVQWSGGHSTVHPLDLMDTTLSTGLVNTTLPTVHFYLMPILRLDTAPCLALASSFFLLGSGAKAFHSLQQGGHVNYQDKSRIGGE